MKQTSFNTPEGYFDNLEENLRSVVFERKDSFAVKVLKPALALVCSFVLVIGIGHTVLHLTEQKDILVVEEPGFGDLSVELDYMNLSYIEFVDDSLLNQYDINLDEDDIYNYFIADGYVSNSVFQSLTSIEQ